MALLILQRLVLPLALFIAAVLPLPASEPIALPDAPSAVYPVDSPPGPHTEAAGGAGAMVLHPANIVIPRLDAAPALRDFIGASAAGAAQQMLRISNFIQRFPDDGKVASQPTTAYMGYT